MLHTSYKLIVADTDELVHGRAGHVLSDDDGTGHAKDLSEARLALLVADLGEVSLRVL